MGADPVVSFVFAWLSSFFTTFWCVIVVVVLWYWALVLFRSCVVCACVCAGVCLHVYCAGGWVDA